MVEGIRGVAGTGSSEGEGRKPSVIVSEQVPSLFSIISDLSNNLL